MNIAGAIVGTAAVLLLGASVQSANETLTLCSPLDYQVVQRQTATEGALHLQGKTTFMAEKWQYRLPGKPLAGQADEAWHDFPSPVKDGAFDFTVKAPAGGWYRLEVRGVSASQTAVEARVAHVGVGEVFIVAGQSNAGNFGSEKQITKTGNVGSFNGERWALANDPQQGADGSGGSFMPAFGDAMNERFHAPIGIIGIAAGGTSVREWLPKGERMQQQPTTGANVTPVGPGEWESTGDLFDRLVKRFTLLGPQGFRAVLWHQGESDAGQVRWGYPADRQITGEQYTKFMEKLIRASRARAGWEVPWFVALTTIHSPTEPPDEEFRSAQKALWESGLAGEGPDTDALNGDNRVDVHFSGKGLRAHGKLWADKVGAWLEKQIAPEGKPASSVQAANDRATNPRPAAPAAAATDIEPQRTYALIVGVLGWSDKSVSSFSKKNRKDRELFDTLARTGVPKTNMTILLDDKATLRGMRKGLSTVLGRATPDSTFIFYYAGHGSPGAFLNYDCTSNGKEERSFNLSEITAAIKKHFKGKNVLLMADCCYSGGLGAVANDLAAAGFKAASLTSADATVESSGNWTFSQTILDALNGSVFFDSNNDGVITLGETAAEVSSEMKFRERQLSGCTFAGLPKSWRLARTKGATVPPGPAPGSFPLKEYVEAPYEKETRVGRIVGWEKGRYLVEFYGYTEKTRGAFTPAQLSAVKFKQCEPGKTVTVSWRNEPVAARVVRLQNGFHLISYIGWPSYWQEWVLADRILGDPAQHPPLKNVVLVEWGGKWWPATIMTTDSEKKRYHVHYVGYGKTYDEWVADKRMRRIDPVE